LEAIVDMLTQSCHGLGGHDAPYHDFAAIYDCIMGGAVAPVIESAFEHSRRSYRIRFGSAADAGCGTGTFLLRLARFCSTLFGVDCSADMLAVAQQKTKGLGIRFLQQDLRAFALPWPVDLITCNFDTLNYLPSIADLRRAFLRFQRNLGAGGHLLFDVITGAGERGRIRQMVQKIALPHVTARWLIRTDGSARKTVVDMRWLTPSTHGRAAIRREIHIQRWYPLPVLCQLVTEVGLRVKGIHEMATYRRASPGSFWVHFVVCKDE
jgi:SAM-dependent methyltransferase